MQYSQVLWRELYELEEVLSVRQLYKFDVLWLLHEDDYNLSTETYLEISGK